MAHAPLRGPLRPWRSLARGFTAPTCHVKKGGNLRLPPFRVRRGAWGSLAGKPARPLTGALSAS